MNEDRERCQEIINKLIYGCIGSILSFLILNQSINQNKKEPPLLSYPNNQPIWMEEVREMRWLEMRWLNERRDDIGDGNWEQEDMVIERRLDER